MAALEASRLVGSAVSSSNIAYISMSIVVFQVCAYPQAIPNFPYGTPAYATCVFLHAEGRGAMYSSLSSATF